LGYSFGGLVAHEAARCLEAAGNKIAFLGLLDTEVGFVQASLGPAPIATRISRLRERLATLGLPRTLAMWLGFRFAAAVWSLPILARILAVRPRLPLPMEVAFFFEYRMTWLVRASLVRAWQPRPLESAALLIRASSRERLVDADLGWRTSTPNLDVREVEGTHYSIISGESGAWVAATVRDAIG
jgi:thioesterase domain-containing protein